MEKFKEKLASLRAEIDNANKRGDELEEKATALETQHANKDDEFTSLQERAKLLEEQLEQAEIDLKEANGNFREADLRAEQLGKKAIKLQQELKTWEKKNSDLEEKYLAAKNEMDELEGQLDGV
ncbi:hypothetical protein [Absidia glauca]|uniref:Tropomyosin n=1 Tax=Absidia glauca TaxID=4829 RepID=A0A168QKC3_ABSGL|nr:hypothetical protein [Absidia glauca]